MVQCRDRYNQHAKPQLKKGEWAREEIESLVSQHRAGEGSWALMAKVMGTGRSDNDVKNKFNAMFRKQRFSDAERTGAPAALVAYILELRAARSEAPNAAEAPRRRQQRAASVDSDNNSAGEAATPPAAPPPPLNRPRRQTRTPRQYGMEQEPEADPLSAGAVELMPAWQSAATPECELVQFLLADQNTPDDFNCGLDLDVFFGNNDFSDFILPGIDCWELDGPMPL